MTIVIPAEKVLELLNLPYFEEIREERIEKHKQGSKKTAKLESTTPKDSENINHKEDFDRLLKSAVTNPPAGD